MKQASRYFQHFSSMSIWSSFEIPFSYALSEDFTYLQVIHGLLDRTMQLLEVPYTEDKTSAHGYYLEAHAGICVTP